MYVVCSTVLPGSVVSVSFFLKVQVNNKEKEVFELYQNCMCTPPVICNT